VSRKTAKLIREQCSDLRVEERGLVEIKGKGNVRESGVCMLLCLCVFFFGLMLVSEERGIVDSWLTLRLAYTLHFQVLTFLPVYDPVCCAMLKELWVRYGMHISWCVKSKKAWHDSLFMLVYVHVSYVCSDASACRRMQRGVEHHAVEPRLDHVAQTCVATKALLIQSMSTDADLLGHASTVCLRCRL
jgi:hypothetical protein